MNISLFSETIDYLKEEIQMGRLPGAVLLVGNSNQVLFHEAVGYAKVYPERIPMYKDTLFDIASLTKVVATSFAIMQLVDKNRIDLETKLHSILPDFKGNGKDGISVWNLLTHTSGFPSEVPLQGYEWTKYELDDCLLSTDVAYPVGSRVIYSDLNYILLGKIVEKVTGITLDRYCQQEIFQPLRMSNTHFNPPKGKYQNVAATEFRRYFGHYRCGEVHDRKATILGGVSGHAGLFSTAEDLAAFTTCFLHGGKYQGRELLKEETVRNMIKNHTSTLNYFRGLGFVVYEPGDNSFGGYFNTQGYGHTGFTGTSIYVNTMIDIYIILLTNRVHFGRTDDIFFIRNKVHELIAHYFK